MKNSTRWFQKLTEQNTRTNLAQLPVLIAAGPNAQSQPESNDGTFFVVGKSEVGGEEIAG